DSSSCLAILPLGPMVMANQEVRSLCCAVKKRFKTTSQGRKVCSSSTLNTISLLSKLSKFSYAFPYSSAVN
ncbi:hypothetical protein D5086_024583, partial [Populus alba]